MMDYLISAKKSFTFSNWELGKEDSITEENPTAAAWILVAVGMSAEMLILLPFWHDECIHFPGRTKKYIVKIWKLFYEISFI